MNSDSKYIVQNRNEKELKEYIMMLWHKKWLIIALVITAILASYFITGQMQRIYQTSTMLMVQSEGGAESLFSEQLSFVGQNDKLLNTYSRIFTSRRIMEKVISELELENQNGDPIPVGALRQNISIQSGQDTDLITVQVNYHDPELAKKIANSVVENMQQETKELNQASLTGASDFIDSQLESTQKRLSELEDQLLEYREEHELLMPETQGESLLERYAELEGKMAESELMQQEAEISLNEINQKLEETDQKVISSESINRNPEINSIQSNLTSLYTELEGLRTKYTEKHPEVQAVQAKIDNLEQTLDNKAEEIVSGRTETNNPLYQNLNEQIIELEVQQVSSTARTEVYEERLAEMEAELDSFPQAELDFLRLQREKNVAEEIYLLLRNRKEEINIQQAMQTSDIFVIDNAYLPENPIKPNLMLNLAVAALLALMLAVGIIFLLDYLDNTIKNEDDLEGISDLPVLGIIPDLDQIDHRKNYGEEDQNGEKK